MRPPHLTQLFFLRPRLALPISLLPRGPAFPFQSDLRFACFIAMAPKQAEKGKKPLSLPTAPPPFEPALGRPRVLNDEAMDKVRPMLASSFNEWGETVAWPASRTRMAQAATEVPIFIDALWAGLIPPFSAFFNAVLEHYQIHMLHLDPQSVTLLAVFAFLCEAMVGIAPSVALLRHFFLLHLTGHRQSSGCVGFQTVAATAGAGIDFELPSSTSEFRIRWVFVDAGVLSPLLQVPAGPAVPNSGWGHQKLTSPRLAPVWFRLGKLKERGVTAPMVVKEFVKRRVAPLQRHSRPMWTLLSSQDHMRFQESGLPLGTRQTVLKVLTGVPVGVKTGGSRVGGPELCV